MGVPTRLLLFLGLLVAVAGGAAALGAAVNPDGAEDRAGESHGGGGHAAENDHGDTLPGLAAAQDGYRLVLERTVPAARGRTRLAFRIEDDHGPVREFDVAHAKRLHLIVVRRDLSSFEHLHPRMATDGTWSASARLSAAGTYRVYADFTIDGTQRTLGADVQVPGSFAPRELPAVADSARDDHGLEVRRHTEADGTVAFQVLRDGRNVNAALEDYLGAKGHLVTLRAGDLAYLHTHPAGDRLAFGVELPGAAKYRSWVQFKLDGEVHTAAFTEEGTP